MHYNHFKKSIIFSHYPEPFQQGFDNLLFINFLRNQMITSFELITFSDFLRQFKTQSKSEAIL